MRLLLTIQYLGTRYGGWQAQTNALSIQQVIEEALATLFGQPIRLHGAGRTDAGVHALAQRAHFDAPFDIPPRGVVLGLNQLLPHDVRIARVEPVADDFHARFAAKVKTYEYRIWNGEVADVFAAETHAHVARPLDADVMRDAAVALHGQHDFRAFTVADPEVSSTVRTMHSVQVTRDEQTIRIRLSADGFLRYMVRRIAGSLIEIGRGKLPRNALVHSLEPEFAAARWTAPAKGLVLVDVSY
ncbi:MAG TPA: tRNA pseudouridine(38-40) synthase TruA [Thermoanaerobaculia bacterium]|nr:tRNA pseudouridine(38-40) synthase TruA [Thermoanaerobaculia bacterium]